MEVINQQRPRVGLAVHIYKDGRTLLMFRTGKHAGQCWGTAGGKLELGESFLNCSKREVKEELGLDIEGVELLGVTNDIFSNDSHYVTLHILATGVTGQEKIMEPEKCGEISWFKLNELPKPLMLPVQNYLTSTPKCLCGSGKLLNDCHGKIL